MQRPLHFGVIACLGLAQAFAFFAGSAAAQDYPSRPIRLVVPQAPGSSSDTIARIVAIELSRQLGQQVVVDNRPGGALTIGMEIVSKAAPDGYTLGYAPIGAMAIGPHMLSKLNYDVQKDFIPVAQTASNQLMLAASPKTSIMSVRDVISQAKQNPDKLFYASSGNGTPGQVGMELFKAMSGAKITHVPYKGGAAGIADLIAGQVQLMMEGLNSITPHAKAGRVRALGVSGPKRSPALPDVPTIAEGGVAGYEATTWNGIVVPAGTPRTLVTLLNQKINASLASPFVREKFAAIGAEPGNKTPEEYAAFIRAEYKKWGEVVKRSGAKIQ